MQLLTISELSLASGWPVSRIRRLIRNRRLVHLRLDGKTLLPENAISDFIGRSLVHPEVGAGE